jgi:hypothetical protein
MCLDNFEEWSATVEHLRCPTVKLPPGYRRQELDQERALRQRQADSIADLTYGYRQEAFDP